MNACDDGHLEGVDASDHRVRGVSQLRQKRAAVRGGRHRSDVAARAEPVTAPPQEDDTDQVVRDRPGHGLIEGCDELAVEGVGRPRLVEGDDGDAVVDGVQDRRFGHVGPSQWVLDGVEDRWSARACRTARRRINRIDCAERPRRWSTGGAEHGRREKGDRRWS
jgi:hypothetical protein